MTGSKQSEAKAKLEALFTAEKAFMQEKDRYSELVGWRADGKALFFSEVWGTSFRLMALPLNGAPVVIDQRKGMSLGGVYVARE